MLEQRSLLQPQQEYKKLLPMALLLMQKDISQLLLEILHMLKVTEHMLKVMLHIQKDLTLKQV
jgi:hypothetical protein